MKNTAISDKSFAPTHVVHRNVANIFAPDVDGSYERRNPRLVSQAIKGERVQVHRTLPLRDGFSQEAYSISTADGTNGWMLGPLSYPDHPANPHLPLAAIGDEEEGVEAVVIERFADVFTPGGFGKGNILGCLPMGSRVRCIGEPRKQKGGYLLQSISLGPQRRKSLAPQPAYVFADFLSKELPEQVINLAKSPLTALSNKAVAVASQLIGSPYLSGGTTPFGMDAAAFVQLIYRMAGGIILPRTLEAQTQDKHYRCSEQRGRGIWNPQGEFKPGVLYFFREGGKYTSVGIGTNYDCLICCSPQLETIGYHYLHEELPLGKMDRAVALIHPRPR